ncbi:MAG: pyridoxal kinase PdxY [Alphaproteobacteria bacterium]
MAVLAIQSQVARGHVGNSAGAFTLQRLGHEVWQMPTVLFSNHPGHGVYKGGAVEPDLIADMVDALDEQGLLSKVEAVLSGYLGDPDQVEVIERAVERVKDQNPNALYICDPVIGDGDEVYVDENVREGIAEDLVPLADYVTPNRLELQKLLEHDEPVENINDAIEKARMLRCSNVIVTSIEDEPRYPGQIQTLLVAPNSAHVISMPKLDFDPKGAGDVLTAMFLSGLLKGKPVEQALAQANGSLYDILAATHRAGADELVLIAQQERLVNPFTTAVISRA